MPTMARPTPSGTAAQPALMTKPSTTQRNAPSASPGAAALRAHRASPNGPSAAANGPGSAGPADAARGEFVVEGSETWYRIEACETLPPFFMSLAGDSDLWAFVSTAGSLAAGRRDEDGAFLPYETVDKIHTRWQHTGPRTWILIDRAGGVELWEPFAQTAASSTARRSVWKNLSGTCIRLREEHAGGRPGLRVRMVQRRVTRPGAQRAPALPERRPGHRRARARRPAQPDPARHRRTHRGDDEQPDRRLQMERGGCGGRLGLFTLYAQIWDRAEPKESFNALVAWHSGLPEGTRTLLSAHQVERFCRGEALHAEPLTRGRRGAFLVQFDAELDETGREWHLVVDAPYSQVQAFELARRLEAGAGSPLEIARARADNTAGVDELLARADGFQTPATRWPPRTTAPTCSSTSCAAACSSTAPSSTATTCWPSPGSATIASAPSWPSTAVGSAGRSSASRPWRRCVPLGKRRPSACCSSTCR
jgi:hypothetical protein